jgi:hypothetical protein
MGLAARKKGDYAANGKTRALTGFGTAEDHL